LLSYHLSALPITFTHAQLLRLRPRDDHSSDRDDEDNGFGSGSDSLPDLIEVATTPTSIPHGRAAARAKMAIENIAYAPSAAGTWSQYEHFG
jgi:hypothetical protein